MLETKEKTLEEKIAHHEKEAGQWIEVIKKVDTPEGLLLALEQG